MVTVEETRRVRLQNLVKEHGSMANLCEKLGYARTETATLTRILNGNIRHDRGGKAYNMGGPMARQIEEKLDLPLGYMDTPPALEYSPESEKIRLMVKAMEAMPEWQLNLAMKIITSIDEPPAKSNGTHKD